MCIYMYMYTQTHTQTHIHTYIHTYMYTALHTYKYTHTGMQYLSIPLLIFLFLSSFLDASSQYSVFPRR